MERRRKESRGDLRENPPTNGIVRHNSHLRKSDDPPPCWWFLDWGGSGRLLDWGGSGGLLDWGGSGGLLNGGGSGGLLDGGGSGGLLDWGGSGGLLDVGGSGGLLVGGGSGGLLDWGGSGGLLYWGRVWPVVGLGRVGRIVGLRRVGRDIGTCTVDMRRCRAETAVAMSVYGTRANSADVLSLGVSKFEDKSISRVAHVNFQTTLQLFDKYTAIGVLCYEPLLVANTCDWWDFLQLCDVTQAEPVSLLASHHGDPGSIPDRVTPDFRKWETCRTTPFVGGFSRGSPFPPPLHSGADPYSLQSPSSTLKTSIFQGISENLVKNKITEINKMTNGNTTVARTIRDVRPTCCLAMRGPVAVGRAPLRPSPPQADPLNTTSPGAGGMIDSRSGSHHNPYSTLLEESTT
ncbi:hypothetical protein PR048_027404 [Dryococelus australis]|uniref:Uncharacterized protein n=1 Tax=Dryococelus australis TaxID=614101 RepID=A0ABQ9GFD5_9NEOP|nr:hypothetical protein PR048_027404 [Dryococelus australis]